MKSRLIAGCSLGAALLVGACSQVSAWQRADAPEHHTIAIWPVLNATGRALNARRFGRIPTEKVTADATLESLLGLPRQSLPQLAGALLSRMLRARGYRVLEVDAPADAALDSDGAESWRRFDERRNPRAGATDFAERLRDLARDHQVTLALLVAVTHFDEGIDDSGADWAEFGAQFVLVDAATGNSCAEGVWDCWRDADDPIKDVELLEERYFLNETEALLERFLRQALAALGI